MRLTDLDDMVNMTDDELMEAAKAFLGAATRNLEEGRISFTSMACAEVCDITRLLTSRKLDRSRQAFLDMPTQEWNGQ